MTPTHHTKAHCRRYVEGEARHFELTGRLAQTVWYLIEAGTEGVTALEMSSWALRLGAYVHVLRHEYGLDITTAREEHEGGWHGRYVLHTPVEIIGIQF